LVVVGIAHMEYVGYDALREKSLWEYFEKYFWQQIVVVQKDLKECGMHSHLWLQVVIGGFIKLVVSYVLSD
jgi:hypothetical protein